MMFNYSVHVLCVFVFVLFIMVCPPVVYVFPVLVLFCFVPRWSVLCVVFVTFALFLFLSVLRNVSEVFFFMF